jgi:hypothetical protein
MFAWEMLDATAGGNVVGLIVENLDGMTYEAHKRMAVE